MKKDIESPFSRDSAATARWFISGLLAVAFSSCVPTVEPKTVDAPLPDSFGTSSDPNNSATVEWKEVFKDPNLLALIDTALKNNQELNIFLQEIEVAKNEVLTRSGAYLPFVDLGGAAGLDKTADFTRSGAVEQNLPISPGKAFPGRLPNFIVGARASWEIDIWHKLRDAEKSAISRFIATQEGQRFLVTNLISEVANSYYELRAFDSQLEIVKQNVAIQTNALDTIRLEKDAARVTELAVRRFEAQLLKTESLQYDLQQKIFERENKLNFLLGRFPQPVQRVGEAFVSSMPQMISAGIPSQLLENRPDIRQAELEITAAELDTKVARAAFYPSLNLSAEVGYEAYRLGKILQTPESLLYSIAGGLTGPLINRRAITADLYTANARQIQAAFNYERTVLNAFVESTNQISNIKNLESSVSLRMKQVEALTSSIGIANTLFTSARADYTEVLLTQREAIESKFELIEAKMRQMQAVVNLYRALGGGWTREKEKV